MIPKKLLHEILEDPFYKTCVRHKEGTCKGRVTFEHALIYAGKQIQEKWAIIPLCEYHHGVNNYQDRGDLKKSYNEWVAVNRATADDFARYPRRNWLQVQAALNARYGNPT